MSSPLKKTKKQSKEFEGLILSHLGKGYYVEVGEDVWLCRSRKRLFHGDKRITPVVGDNVLLEPTKEDKRGVITQVIERYSVLSRRHPGMLQKREQIVVSNVDQALICMALHNPPFRKGLVDRYLVTTERARIKAQLILNKIDLAENEGEVSSIIQWYQQLGYNVLCTSARTTEGLENFRTLLQNKRSVFVGPSGVGKSSLLNRLQPDLHLRTGEVNPKTGRGCHTTTTALLVPMAGGYLVDTPGIREFGLWGIELEDLTHLFVEFRPYLEQCRFRNCTHRAEPQCQVKEALAVGEITEQRYQSYLRLYEELSEKEH